MSLPPRKVGNALTFETLGTSESARQRVAWNDRNGDALTGDSLNLLVFRGARLDRVAGSGNITVQIRLYLASSGDVPVYSFSVPLTASGDGARVLVPDQGSAPTSWDIYSETGIWMTAEASSGSGHEVDVTPILGARTAP